METRRFTFLGWPDGYEEVFLPLWYFLIKDGSQIRFWEDSWLGNSPLREQYPALYSIVRRKSDTIALVMATAPPDVTFRCDLIGPRLAAWNALLQRLDSLQLSVGLMNFVGTCISMENFL
jgi:hypothetical protein